MASYDAIIVGGGQAGAPLAFRLAGAGRRVALIEREHLGGTCVNTGCTPTKTMVASAYTIRQMRRAAEYGIALDGSFHADLARVQARKDAIVADKRDGLTHAIEATPNCTLVRGHASFVAPHEIEVAGERLSAGQIFLNLGASSVIPRIAGLDEVPFLDNVSIMALATLPRHLVVIGGGTIAVEFAQMFRRFGSEVTVVEHGPRLASREDEDVSDAIRTILEAEGIGIECGAGIARASRGASGGEGADIVLHLDGGREIAGSHLLVATGRRPNTDDLGVEAAGLQTDGRGFLVVDDELRTNVPGIWAMGDCNGRGAFTHTAYNDYEIVAANLLDGARRRVSDRIDTYAIYIDPPLGRVGMTLAQAKASGRRVLAGERPMTAVARAVEKGETHGFMRFLVDADTERFLGAHILGPGGDEAIHAILDAMAADAPYTVLRDAMHIHPTVSELIPTTLQGLEPVR